MWKQINVSWGEIWLFLTTAFMVWWCLSMIPLPLRWYADLKYHLTPHFSHICQKTSKGNLYHYLSAPLLLAPSPETPPQQLSLSLLLSLFWFFAIYLLSQVHSQSWIGTAIMCDIDGQLLPIFCYIQLPFFVAWQHRVNGLTLPTLLHHLLNNFHCDVWIHFPHQIQSSFLPKMVHILQVFQVFSDTAHWSRLFLLP